MKNGLGLSLSLSHRSGGGESGLIPYGVSFNFTVPPGTNAGNYTRLGALSEYNNSSGLALPWTADIGKACQIQNRMRRCIMPDTIADPTNPQNSVAYYLDPLDSTKKADGALANLDGTDGQVMVEIPRFWQKTVWNETTQVMEWWICGQPISGYTVHPAFKKIIGNVLVEVPYRYIGAYQGVLQDSDGAYKDYYDYTGTHKRTVTTERLLANIATAKLGSVKGYLPVAQGTRDHFRKAARRRDGNTDDSTWRLTDWSLWSAVQLLLLTEFATFNSQSALTGNAANGLSNLASATWTASVVGGSSTLFPLVATGGTETLGNNSGKIRLTSLYGDGSGMPVYTGTANAFWVDDIPSYRGIEVPYGHIWQWLDGVIYEYTTSTQLNVYLAAGKFSDSIGTQYEAVLAHGGVSNAPASGYVTKIQELAASQGFFAKAVGGSSLTGLADYYYTGTGVRVVAVGGASYNGGGAGVFYVNAFYDSGNRTPFIGGRLCL